jgi:hypothetical protein
MDEPTYADAGLRAEWYRNHAWLPGEGLDDTVMDFYKPRHFGQRSDESVIDIRKFSDAARGALKTLKVGATRKQVRLVFGRAGGAYSPFHRQLYNLDEKFAADIPLGPHEWISVEIDFVPAGTHGAQRDAREPVDFPKESEDDVVTGFTRPFVSPRGLYTD